MGPGDRVLVAVWPGVDLYAGLAAVWRRGAVAVFPEPSTGLAGLRHAAAAARPKAVLGGRPVRLLALFLRELRSIPVRADPGNLEGPGTDGPVRNGPADPALISFTSGTSGRPKGMVRSHGLMLAQHDALAGLISPGGAPGTDLVAFPAFVLTCLGHGRTAVMPDWDIRRHDRADPAALVRRMSRLGAARALVPPVIAASLAGRRLPGTVERVMTGGGPVYPDVMRRFLEGSPGTGLTVVYGSTEAEPVSHMAAEDLDSADWLAAAGGGGLPAGRPVPEVRVRIPGGEGGEIEVAGAHVVGGYLDPARDAETKIREGGTVWHRTGDAGRLDARGRLWLLGRSASVAGGLFPFAVEAAARLWPGVAAAALASVPGGPVLLVQGDSRHAGDWRRRAAGLGGFAVRPVRGIVMDRRHRSKPDIAATLARHGAGD